ncbi:MAG: histidine phosphatase family protein [Thermodesulfobacteriota bacterium]
MKKLCIALVGLPAMGKSTLAQKLKANITEEGFQAEVFNNGQVRRESIEQDTSKVSFYQSEKGKQVLENIAHYNIRRAQDFLAKGDVVILDATNATEKRRQLIENSFKCPTLFIKCHYSDEEILSASIWQKTKMSEFGHMSELDAFSSFEQRINFYQQIYEPLQTERNHLTFDTVENHILDVNLADSIPHYVLVRDVLVTDWIKNLYLVRHGKTYYNLEDRIGGNSTLNDTGWQQAQFLGYHFRNTRIPRIFVSEKERTHQMARALLNYQDSKLIVIPEFNEIDAGICENMTYDEIKSRYPEIFRKRMRDKYNYIYPEGEGYITLYDRAIKGLKKALFLSENADHMMIVGHQAVNRIILSYFLYRKTEDVPFTYVPQNKYFHITSGLQNKSIKMQKFTDLT